MKKILAFAGSNSSKSINKQLIRSISGLISDDVEVEIIELNDFEAKVYCIDDEINHGFPDSMVRLHQKFDEADGFIVSSPEHNGSIPTVLKNSLDWISRMEGKIFREKPTLFLSTSPGPRGGASVLKHLLEVMPYRGAEVVGGHSVGNFNDKVIDGTLVEGEDRDQIIDLLKKLVSKL